MRPPFAAILFRTRHRGSVCLGPRHIDRMDIEGVITARPTGVRCALRTWPQLSRDKHGGECFVVDHLVTCGRYDGSQWCSFPKAAKTNAVIAVTSIVLIGVVAFST